MQYPGKIFSADGSLMRVVFGHDEHLIAKKDGWLDEPPKKPEARPVLEHNALPKFAAEVINEGRKRGRPPKSTEVSLGAGQ